MLFLTHVLNKFPPHIHNVISINNSEYLLPVASRVMGANKIIQWVSTKKGIA